mmetsp:Transcript_8775/g.6519  ORF Transcript_8775/g.6519 Transcript_8775/m.6519 type:complete len:84 (-) Transcript_8775:124-375(-)
MLIKYLEKIQRLHVKVKGLTFKMEDIDRHKRHKIRQMRHEMERQLSSLKERNQELFTASSKLEAELDAAVRKVEELQREKEVL